jgi:hypothetical protein
MTSVAYDSAEALRAEIDNADVANLAAQNGAVRRLRHIARRALNNYNLSGVRGLSHEQQLQRLDAVLEDEANIMLALDAVKLAKQVILARATAAVDAKVQAEAKLAKVPTTQDGQPAKSSSQYKANKLAEVALEHGFVTEVKSRGPRATVVAEHADGRSLTMTWVDGVAQPGTRRRPNGDELIVRNASDAAKVFQGVLV